MFLQSRMSLFVLAPVVAMLAAPLMAQDAVTVLNRCLTRSTFTRIEADGHVEIKGPEQTYRFNLKQAGFNINTENGDHRLRVASESPYLRQSFLCRDGEAVKEAVRVLRQQRREALAKDERSRHLAKRIDTGELGLPFKTVGEALEFLNDRLSLSVVSSLDAQGILSLCGADGVYRIDLRKADFSLNDRGERAKVRIYGDWALEYAPGGHGRRSMTRESFSTESARETLEIVKALYVLKAAQMGQAPRVVVNQANVDPAFKPDTKTLQGAADALNGKLALSRILSIDAKGLVTLNASEHMYQFDLTRCSFDRPRPGEGFKGWIESKVNVQPQEGIVIKGDLKRFRDPQSYDRQDEVILSTETYFDTQDALALLKDLQGRFAKK